jgi:D-alanyl-D-alanine carboxypeptidase
VAGIVRVALVGVVLALVAAAAAPADISKVQGLRAEVADPLTALSYGGKSPGIEEGAMASTTKVMSMHVVFEAVAAGYVSLSDQVEMSGYASLNGCACLTGQDVLAAGDTMTLDDALFAMAMASANDVTGAVAEFVANAVENGQKDSGDNIFESIMLENEFVSMMNDDAFTMGLTKTHFVNPQGWDDPDHYSTAAELTKIWAQTAKDTLLLKYTGARSHSFTWFDVSAQQTKTFTGTKSYSYFPGVDGDKNGITPNCVFCVVAQATRLGRPLVAAVMQSPTFTQSFLDIGELFRSGYAAMFQPHEEASAESGTIKDHALACTDTRAISAVRNDSGDLRLTTWQSNVGAGALWSTASLELPTTEVEAVDVAYLRPDAALVGTLTPGGDAVLYTVKVDQAGAPSIVAKVALGQAVNLAVHALSGSLAAAIAVKPNGAGFEVRTLIVKPDATVVPGAASNSSTAVDEVALASALDHVSLGSQPFDLLGAARNTSTGKLELWSWTVAPATGALSLRDTDPDESAKAISLTSTGYGRFAAAFSTAKGGMKVKFFAVDAKGAVSVRGDTGEVPVPVKETAIASIGSAFTGDGAMTAVRTGGGLLSLAVWEFDAKGEAQDKSFYQLAQTTAKGAQQVGVCRLSSAASAGDFLTAVHDPLDKLSVVAWRVGEKP